ncbi:hypothetical protein V8C86DRAFT_3115911 [Haematococcus lacustris]
MLCVHWAQMGPAAPVGAARDLLRSANISYPAGWQEPPTNFNLCKAIHLRRLKHSATTRSNGRVRLVTHLGSPLRWVARLNAKVEARVGRWEERHEMFPRLDGLVKAQLEGEFDDISVALQHVPQDYRPAYMATGVAPTVPPDSMFQRDMRQDPTFDLPARLTFARNLVAQLDADAQACEEDKTVARRLLALLRDFEAGRPSYQVMETAGQLLGAVDAVQRARRHMLRRHFAPKVVRAEILKAIVEVCNAYLTAWVDDDIDKFRSVNPVLVDACLARAKVDPEVADEAWRQQVAYATKHAPPDRDVVERLMAEAWAQGNGGVRTPFSLSYAPAQPSFPDVVAAAASESEDDEPEAAAAAAAMAAAGTAREGGAGGAGPSHCGRRGRGEAQGAGPGQGGVNGDGRGGASARGAARRARSPSPPFHEEDFEGVRLDGRGGDVDDDDSPAARPHHGPHVRRSRVQRGPTDRQLHMRSIGDDMDDIVLQRMRAMQAGANPAPVQQPPQHQAPSTQHPLPQQTQRPSSAVPAPSQLAPAQGIGAAGSLPPSHVQQIRAWAVQHNCVNVVERMVENSPATLLTSGSASDSAAHARGAVGEVDAQALPASAGESGIGVATGLPLHPAAVPQQDPSDDVETGEGDEDEGGPSSHSQDPSDHVGTGEGDEEEEEEDEEQHQDVLPDSDEEVVIDDSSNSEEEAGGDGVDTTQRMSMEPSTNDGDGSHPTSNTLQVTIAWAPLVDGDRGDKKTRTGPCRVP